MVVKRAIIIRTNNCGNEGIQQGQLAKIGSVLSEPPDGLEKHGWELEMLDGDGATKAIFLEKLDWALEILPEVQHVFIYICDTGQLYQGKNQLTFPDGNYPYDGAGSLDERLFNFTNQKGGLCGKITIVVGGWESNFATENFAQLSPLPPDDHVYSSRSHGENVQENMLYGDALENPNNNDFLSAIYEVRLALQGTQTVVIKINGTYL